MECKNCGKNVQYPKIETDYRYGEGWRCRGCNWFNKSYKVKNYKPTPRGSIGCPACGSTDIYQITYDYTNQRLRSLMSCWKCSHMWQKYS